MPNLTDQRLEWQIYQDYFRAPVHIKAQKHYDDLETMLDTTRIMTVAERGESLSVGHP